MIFWGSLIQTTGYFKRSTAFVDPGDQEPPQLSRTGKENGSLETLPGSLRGEGKMGVRVQSCNYLCCSRHPSLGEGKIKGPNRTGKPIEKGAGARCF